jgi:hypothetical protein
MAARPEKEDQALTTTADPGKLTALMLCAKIAKDQRDTADTLGEAVRAARTAGCTWRQIASVLGVSHATAIRQHLAGPSIVVVKAPPQKGTSE